jgi:hypothetical protein
MAAHQRDQIYVWNIQDQSRYTGAISTVLQLHCLSFVVFVSSFCFCLDEKMTKFFLCVSAFLQLFLLFQTGAYGHIEEPLLFHRRQLVRIDRVSMIYVIISIFFNNQQIDYYSIIGLMIFTVLIVETLDLYIYSVCEKELHPSWDGGEPLFMRLRRQI